MASSLVVNTDTYTTLAECDAYLSKNHISTDLTLWNALSDGDCDILLRNAAQLIDSQPLVGLKVLSSQIMEFPRIIYTEYSGRFTNSDPITMSNGDQNWYIQPVVPDSVKNAQCEIALTMSRGESTRNELQRNGVKSFSLGKLSESYTGAGNQLISTEAKRLLKPFTDGGFAIC